MDDESRSSVHMVLRAGYDQSTNLAKAENVTFNIPLPGVIKRHYTEGSTHNFSKDADFTWACMHAAKNTVTGPSMYKGMPNLPSSGITETIRVFQPSLGVQYDWKF